MSDDVIKDWDIETRTGRKKSKGFSSWFKKFEPNWVIGILLILVAFFIFYGSPWGPLGKKKSEPAKKEMVEPIKKKYVDKTVIIPRIKKVYVDKIVEIPRIKKVYVDKIVEVPKIEYVKKIVEVPVYQKRVVPVTSIKRQDVRALCKSYEKVNYWGYDE